MIVIGHSLISDEIITEHFACQLAACGGACCIEGELGAPLEENELPVLEAIVPKISDLLTSAGRRAIEEQGPYLRDTHGLHTPLIDGGPCAYYFREGGIAYCAIEKAWEQGRSGFRKPISCALYPIRITYTPRGGTLLNYERWNICAPACVHGKAQKIKVYEFLKEPLIRRFGKAFYEELDAVARDLERREGSSGE